ncbi:MAG: hypothetical protein IJ885_04190, partial [Prevotella sp.]|nr:hypothetical protein [Prevotella sp.]
LSSGFFPGLFLCAGNSINLQQAEDGAEADPWPILSKRSFDTELHTDLSTEAQTRMEIHP